jgi:hypothetical protein
MFNTVRPPPSLHLKPPPPPGHRTGLVVSLVLHGLVIGLLLAGGERLFQRPAGSALFGNLAAASGGDGGGPRVAYITLPSPPKAEASAPKPAKVAPPRPAVLPPPEPAEPVAPSETVTPSVDTAASTPSGAELAQGDSARGTGQGAGASAGTGPGTGPGTGGAGPGPGGAGGRVHPPEPRDMAFPFDNPPKELRGLSLNVTFWVRVDGRVERYVVEPEIKDRDYAKKFDEVMRAFRFTPATAPDGTRVPGTTRISFTLPGKSSS